MVGRQRELSDTLINPYIALTDLLINLVLVFLFFSASVLFMGRLGNDDVRYRAAKTAFKQAMEAKFSKSQAYNDEGRNDPAGTQRWVFYGEGLFKGGTAEMLPQGRVTILTFASILRSHKDKWRRIRIEGHTVPPARGEPENWELSARRASEVARLLSSEGHIAPHFLAVAARGGQSQIEYEVTKLQRNERVEFVIEYAKVAALGEDLPVYSSTSSPAVRQ